jgi:putative flippase GtrA
LYLNGYFMHVLVNRYDVWYILSQVIVNVTLAFWNFIVYRFVIFKNSAENEIKNK